MNWPEFLVLNLSPPVGGADSYKAKQTHKYEQILHNMNTDSNMAQMLTAWIFTNYSKLYATDVNDRRANGRT